jgi:hypothetical protein
MAPHQSPRVQGAALLTLAAGLVSGGLFALSRSQNKLATAPLVLLAAPFALLSLWVGWMLAAGGVRLDDDPGDDGSLPGA